MHRRRRPLWRRTTGLGHLSGRSVINSRTSPSHRSIAAVVVAACRGARWTDRRESAAPTVRTVVRHRHPVTVSVESGVSGIRACAGGPPTRAAKRLGARSTGRDLLQACFAAPLKTHTSPCSTSAGSAVQHAAFRHQRRVTPRGFKFAPLSSARHIRTSRRPAEHDQAATR
jgi:hypothetical protein